MIQGIITSTMLNSITTIEEKRLKTDHVQIPASQKNRMMKNSRKRSSYASNKIEGNPLSEEQVSEVLNSDDHKHLLKPEQEIRNYYQAIEFLDSQLSLKSPFSLDLILKTQKIVVEGTDKSKTGLRSAMPPGILFAVYDSQTGQPEYIPPEACDIPDLLDELIQYVQSTSDHPLIIAGIVHYQLVTIHPFEDGNGRTARLLSGYLLDLYEYSFQGIGSLEEYFAYDTDEYYTSLQMGLPALYYLGRNNPPHPEIWLEYFLRMVELYAGRVLELSQTASSESIHASLSYLNAKEKELLKQILILSVKKFTPGQIAQIASLSNRTTVNQLAALCKQGFIQPQTGTKRIRYYYLTDMAENAKETILSILCEKPA